MRGVGVVQILMDLSKAAAAEPVKEVKELQQQESHGLLPSDLLSSAFEWFKFFGEGKVTVNRKTQILNALYNFLYYKHMQKKKL